jgi:hypothetical protein
LPSVVLYQQPPSPGAPSFAHFAKGGMTNAQPSQTHLPLPVFLTETKESSFRPKLLTQFVSSAVEKSASLSELSRRNSFHSLYPPAIYFSPFSAQKSHVKP